MKEETKPAWVRELLEKLNKPDTPEEQERWRQVLENADRIRVKVGRDFNTAREIRKIRDHGESLD